MAIFNSYVKLPEGMIFGDRELLGMMTSNEFPDIFCQDTCLFFSHGELDFFFNQQKY